MSNYKLTFKLKQHTPLIHFQHDQAGATLRATELKPKLDKFLIEKFREQNIDYSGWLIAGQERALDYKVRIEAKEKKTSYNNLINVSTYKKRNNRTGIEEEKLRYNNLPNFFGNMMKINEFKNGEKKVKKITFYDEITLQIISFNSELKNNINTYFTDFIAITNFGTRQSKGFGSFYLENQSINNNDYLSFKIQGLKKDDFKKLFEIIELFYKTLKSGLNIKTKNRNHELIDKIYFKSLMFHYAKELNSSEQWDKRTIRHGLYLNDWKYKNDNNRTGIYYNRTENDGTVHYKTNKPDNRNYYDFRDLLGLSTEQDWFFYRDKKITKEVLKERDNDSKYEIERFKSPISFKPIFYKNEWNVNIVLNEIPNLYLGSTVKVKNSRNNVYLTMYPHFDLKDFIDFAINKFNVKDFCYGSSFTYNNTNEPKFLDDIFKQLKKQIKKNIQQP